MEFNTFKDLLKTHIDGMIKNSEKLFLTDVESQDVWNTYLDSFPEGTNVLYKERLEFDCSACKQFIKLFGNVVTIKDNKLVSIWDIPNLEHPFDKVAEGLSNFVKSAKIKDVFLSKETHIGVNKNSQLLENGDVLVWYHFHYELPKIYTIRKSESVGEMKGHFRDSKNVFKRSMDELTTESGKIVLELIDQNSLYRGEEFKSVINSFVSYKEKYEAISDDEKDNWCWVNSIQNPVSRIRNTAIGTLLIDLSEGMDIDEAVTKFEKVMAPSNYKRPKAIFTKRMIEEAEKKLEELGFTDSLGRRFAQLKDITVNNLLFVNRDVKKKLKSSVFDELKEEVPVDTKSFDKVEEVNIEDFIKDILPKTTSIELMVEGRHYGNLMSLIAPENEEAPSMLKWNNNFSWAYNGDITDSIKQNVKKAGGNVEGILRFSIQWNTDTYNPNDFDAHCKEPNGNLIYYGNKGRRHPSSGMLDVDIMNPRKNTPAVENITWVDKSKMQEGIYKFIVHNFSHRGGREGFSAEIEYDGKIYSYEYPKELKSNEKVLVAEVRFSRAGGITFVNSLESTTSSKEIWGINSYTFSKVNVCMFSPNYWDDQESIGNKHYFFFLDGCKNETTPRGFFNEFLNEELMKHKKVFEALGSKMRVAESEEQLSGVGFSSTQRSSILAKIEGAFSRVIKITF